MPVDTSTYQKYYNAVQQAYGKDGSVEKGAFNLGYDDFKTKMANQEYAQKIYNALDHAYGKEGVSERGAFTLPFDDFYKKVSLTAPSTPASPPPSIADVFRPVRESGPSLDTPTNLLPGTLADQHSKEVERAANNLTQTFNENKDKAISHIINTDLKRQSDRLNSAFQNGQLDEKEYNKGQQQLFNQMINPTPAIAAYKQGMATNENKVRNVVSAIAETNPNKAQQLKADMYLLDSQKRPEKAALILKNANSIANDQGIDYDVKRGNLKNKEGFFASLGQGFAERNRMMNDYDFYANGTPENVINRLEGQRASYDPDLPVNTPYGIGGHLGSAIGMTGISTAKATVAGGATSLIPVAGEVAAPWVAAAVVSPEFYKIGYVSSFENEYHNLRNQGINPVEALNRAKEKAEFDAKVDVAQGALSTAVGTRIGIKKGEFTPTFQNTIKNIAIHSGKWLTETGIEGGANALIAGGLQELKNIHADKPAEEGAFDTGMGQLFFSYGVGALTHAGRALLNPKAYTSVLQTMARAPESEINSHLTQMVNDGSITESDAADVHSQLAAQRELDNRIPPEITNDKDRSKIQDLIKQRDALDAKLESMDKAYHPELKEQIKALNEKIAGIGKEPSPEEKAPSTEPTFKDQADQHRVMLNKEIQKGEADWTKVDVYRNMAEANPTEFLKFIADQASSEATRENTEKLFGKNLVEKSIQSQLKPEYGKETERGNAPEAERQVIQEGTAQPAPIEAVPPVEHTSWARTLDYGENKGKEENESAKEKIKEEIVNDAPIGKTGERFSQLLGRVIPGIEKVMAEEQHNTTVVTHSSVIKALKVWEEMGRPKLEELNGEKLKKFAQKYVDLKPEAEGKVHTFKADNGNEIKVVRHGETEDNKLSEFRQDDTQLTDKGIAQARRAGDNLVRETGGNIPKIISSDLPRTVHTSQIISDVLKEKQGEYPKITNVKLKENAIQERRPEEVLQREQGPNDGSGGGRGQMESGEQGNESAGESGRQPAETTPEGEKSAAEKAAIPPEKGDDWPFVEEPEDNEVTSLKNAVTAQKVEDAGLMPAMKEARREFGEVWTEAQKKLSKGYDVEGLIDDLKKKPRPITDLENAMILYHQNVKESQLVQANKDLDVARASNDRAGWNEAYNTRAKLLDDLQKIYDVDKAVGTANARGLNARKMMADRRFSLVNMQAEKRATNGGEPLTDKQLEEVQQQFEEIKKTKEAYEARVEQLKKETASLEAERNFQRLRGDIKEEKISKKKTEIKKDLAANFQELRQILKEQRSKLSANPIPVEAIPVIGKMAKNLIRLGAVKLTEVAHHIYNELKGDIDGLTEEHVQEAIDAATDAERLARFKKNVVESKLRTEMKTRTGDFSKKTTRPLVLDKEALELKAAYEKAKGKYELGLKKDQLAQRTKFQKTVDTFTKWERAFKLSNPVTLAKLSMAAITRLAQTPVEEGIGGVYSAILPELAKRAEGEGGVNVKALAKGYKEAFTTGMKDAYDVLKSGKSNIDYALGKGEQLPPEAIEFFGQLHSAIKAPVKRFAFERSLEKRLSKNIANGVDVTDPDVQMRLLTDAYKDSQRAIFMQDNFVSKQWQRVVSSLEKTASKETNTELEKGLAKSTAATLQFLVPFVKVPSNIVGEVGTHTLGLPIAGVKGIHLIFTKGISEMSPGEADFILRNMKKGTLGAGALLLGYLRPDLFGGYYQPYEKRKEGELKAGEMNVGGLHVPIWLLESPIFQTMQLGATIRKAKDKIVQGQEQGIGEGIWADGLGLAQHEPLVDQPVRMSKLFGKPAERTYYLGELAKSTIDPALLDWAAKITDPEDKRKPTTILEHVKTGIPGLRETVPTKKESDRGGDSDGGGAGGSFDR